jgi:hypothetical protein
MKLPKEYELVFCQNPVRIENIDIAGGNRQIHRKQETDQNNG